MAAINKSVDTIPAAVGIPQVKDGQGDAYRPSETAEKWIHTDAVYNVLINAAGIMEARLKDSLERYEEHPDVQANLQQLQYDLQSWNLALTTMTNIQKSMSDALHSITNNFK